MPSLSVADGAQYRKVYFSSLKAAASLALKQTDGLSRRDKPFLVPLLGWGKFWGRRWWETPTITSPILVVSFALFPWGSYRWLGEVVLDEFSGSLSLFCWMYTFHTHTYNSTQEQRLKHSYPLTCNSTLKDRWFRLALINSLHSFSENIVDFF